jgi:hypothetical protein
LRISIAKLYQAIKKPLPASGKGFKKQKDLYPKQAKVLLTTLRLPTKPGALNSEMTTLL